MAAGWALSELPGQAPSGALGCLDREKTPAADAGRAGDEQTEKMPGMSAFMVSPFEWGSVLPTGPL